MATDVSEVIGAAIGNAARDVIQNVSKGARKRSRRLLPNPKGVTAGAAGVGLLALAPLAKKGVSAAASQAADKGAGQLKSKIGDQMSEKVKGDVKDAIPGSGLFSKSGKSESGGLFSKGGKSEDVEGVGKGRRMPVQQDFDIGVPVSTVYNQWTQFEEWPKFMHRVTQVSQDDDTHVKVKTKIWGMSREFTAVIVEQRPDERIQWRVDDGVTHNGVITFHEIGPRLTRVELNLDVEPGSLIEKGARGMRHVKRAVRGDMARFKAYVLMAEEESGAWRGQIEDEEVKKSSSNRRQSASSNRRQSGSANRGQSDSNSGRGRATTSRSSQSRGRSASSPRRARSSSKRARGATDGDRGSSRGSGRAASSRKRTSSHS